MEAIGIALAVLLVFAATRIVLSTIFGAWDFIEAQRAAADIRRRIDEINADIPEDKDPMVTDDGVFRYWELPDG